MSSEKQQAKRKHTAEQKLKIVLESMQRDTTIEAVRIKYGIAGSVISRWREEFKASQIPMAELAFGDKRNPKKKALRSGYEPGRSPDDLKKIIGEQAVQIEILKKVQGLLV